VGNWSYVESVDPEFADSPNDTGGVDDTLRPMEASIPKTSATTTATMSPRSPKVNR
jgi:hypothetical protein